MKPAEKIEKLIKRLHFKASAEMHDRTINDALSAQEKSKKTKSAQLKPHIWRTIMKSKITKLATAAVIILAVVVSITFLNKSVTPTYGFEQTIEAYRGLRYIHVKNLSPPAHGPQGTWLEFDENGELIRIRVEEGESESFRIMVWANDTIKWWSPPKNEFVVLHKTFSQAKKQMFREQVDPRYAVQSLYDLALGGKMDIEIEQPASEGEPIRLTATDTTPLEDLPPKTYRVRYILLIDPETKLARQREKYFLRDGRYELKSSQLYLEYNKPIDPEMFDLEQPEGVELEDRTKGIGLPQGEMTDMEAAAEVVRQYIEALTAKDYEKAAKLYNGKSADELREWVEERLKIKHVRFIAVGDPIAQPEFGPRAFGVPFAHIIETADGRREISGPWGGLEWSAENESNLDLTKHRQAMVRPVVGQPDRWVIIGGI